MKGLPKARRCHSVLLGHAGRAHRKGAIFKLPGSQKRASQPSKGQPSKGSLLVLIQPSHRRPIDIHRPTPQPGIPGLRWGKSLSQAELRSSVDIMDTLPPDMGLELELPPFDLAILGPKDYGT